MTRLLKAACILAVALLAGCGSEKPKNAANAAPVERAIFISTNDCVDSGKLSMEQCSYAVDNAVAIHQQQAQTYSSLARCAAAEGEDRCDKSVDGYRPRLQAFLVTVAPQPIAVPLYPAAPGRSGFRSAKKEAFAPDNDAYTFSIAALSLANDNAKGGKRK